MRRALVLLSTILLACSARSNLAAVGDGGGDATSEGGVDAATDTPSATYAIYFTGCGPTDGPAYTILTSATAAKGCDGRDHHPDVYDRIDVWSALPTAAGAEVVVTGTSDGKMTGGVAMTCTGDVCQNAQSTTVHFDAVGASSISGSYVMTFADGHTKAGTFTASNCSVAVLCG
jgi:hypothetical protein